MQFVFFSFLIYKIAAGSENTKWFLAKISALNFILLFYKIVIAWKVSKYGPEKTSYLDTFHAAMCSHESSFSFPCIEGLMYCIEV